jgi:plastocyanin
MKTLDSLAAVAAVALGSGACGSSTDYGGGGGGGNNPPQADVIIVSGASFKTTDAFNPNPFTVSLGGAASASVKWGNADNTDHHVLQNGASPTFDSGTLHANGTYTFAFTAPGTYNYHCTIHQNMVGTIQVNQ